MSITASPRAPGAGLDPTPAPAAFLPRHVGLRDLDTAAMLTELGFSSLDELTDAAVPPAIRSRQPLELPAALTEAQAARRLQQLAAANRTRTTMIGLGYHPCEMPGVIRRNVLEDPAWYTAYTPYQPEISQGRLEALLNFQTMVADLTGLQTANASLLDEPTAVAEAVTLMRRASRSRCTTVLVDDELLPQTREVLDTRCEPLGLSVVTFSAAQGLPDRECFAVVLSLPGGTGGLYDPSEVITEAHRRGALVAVATDLLALTLLTSPGELGADVAVGSAQRFGVPMFYGGPHAGFIAVRPGLERNLPGRLVGVSVDAVGRSAYRLALQTREQHIRRDKATSNICTAQVLLAVIAGMYAVYHGPQGLTDIARRVHAHATMLADRLQRAGLSPVHDGFFDTVTVAVPGRAETVADAAAQRGVLLRLVDADHVGVSISEQTTVADIDHVLAAFGVDGSGLDGSGPGVSGLDSLSTRIPAGLRRSSSFLTHPVFAEHRSETEMLRYIRRLARRDYALDRGMIPLGSCTMKLNATTEMEAVGYPGFADLHPFAPTADAVGYAQLIDDLETWLAEITGYAKVTVQPNAGSQGELAGLLAIRSYHHANGDEQRDVCLIPASAHGTNAASAVMAGFRVVVVPSAADGTVDLDALAALCVTHTERLAAIMVTYPSTHGVYEEGITALCELVHDHGGQVYVDGANLNALVGLAQPGVFGGDVSHLNLHKTFCIPHGGGGPGVGPIGVAAHLVAHLPGHGGHPDPGRRSEPGAVSGAPFGSAGILPISWAYVAMMGPDGLRTATQLAVLSANYVAHRLASHYPVLFTGPGGLVAHECVIDLRPLTASTGVTVEDVAKRLIDYGFHAPTMSFPVPGTLMIEPTESESLAELDRFCAAMIAIRGEIDSVADGTWPVEQSPLRHAPHTTEDLTLPWERPYSAVLGAFPTGIDPDKYWPPVGRVQQAYGDRHLVCSCPSPAALADDRQEA